LDLKDDFPLSAEPPSPKEALALVNPHAILIEGHDACLIGIVWLPGQLRPVAMYDDTLLAEALIAKNTGWTMEDAYAWIDSNVPVGTDAPVVIEIMADAEELEDATVWS
jgi:hypothetical protein